MNSAYSVALYFFLHVSRACVIGLGIHMYAYVCACVCLCMCVHVCVCACVHVCMRVCMCVTSYCNDGLPLQNKQRPVLAKFLLNQCSPSYSGVSASVFLFVF